MLKAKEAKISHFGFDHEFPPYFANLIFWFNFSVFVCTEEDILDSKQLYIAISNKQEDTYIDNTLLFFFLNQYRFCQFTVR